MSEFYELIAGPSARVTFLAVLGVVYALAILRFVSAMRAHPRSLSVSVVGYPGAGKTVFITTLFDLLQQGRSKHLKISPYGLETIEAVGRTLTQLSRGEWPPKTSEGGAFFYRALAGSSVVGRLRLEVADFAGEHVNEMVSSSERWLHRSEYFRYVVDADAIVIAVDARAVSSSPPGDTEEIVNGLVASVQVMAEQRGGAGVRRLSAPIAVVLLKTDALEDGVSELVTERIERLLAVCRTSAEHVKLFWVSSTGPVTDERPPMQRVPAGVLEPLEWLFLRSTRTSLLELIEALGIPFLPRRRRRTSYRDDWEFRG